MRDFTKNHLTRTPITKGKLTSAPKQESQKNWQQTIAPIQQPKTASRNWLKQDWFWNIIIWSCVFSSILLVQFTKKSILNNYLHASAFLLLWAIALIIILLRKSKYIRDDIFVNVHGVQLTSRQIPSNVFIFLTFAPALLINIISELFFKPTLVKLSSLIAFFHISSASFFLYFILKNSPISIIFNKEFWRYLNRLTLKKVITQINTVNTELKHKSTNNTDKS